MLLRQPNLIFSMDGETAFGKVSDFRTKEYFAHNVNEIAEQAGFCVKSTLDVIVKPFIRSSAEIQADTLIPLDGVTITIEDYYIAELVPIED